MIVRPPAVYGPRDTDVFEVLKSINQGMVIEIAGGERWFSAIYVADLVDGIIAAAREPRAAGRAYFLTRQGVVSWSELVGIASGIMGRKPRIIRVPPSAAYAIGYGAELWSRLTRRPGIVSRDKVTEMQCRYWVCDTLRAKTDLGFDAPTDIETGLAITLAWYREAGWLKVGDGMPSSDPPVFWPANKVIFVYSAFICAIDLIWFNRIPDAGWLLALHAIAIVLLVLAARRVAERPSVRAQARSGSSGTGTRCSTWRAAIAKWP